MAATTTVRVRQGTQQALVEMAKRHRTTVAAVIERLVDEARANDLLAAHNASVSEPDALEGYLEESGAMEGTLLDGLEGDPWPLDDSGRPRR